MAAQPTQAVSQMTIADPKFRRSIYAFRLLLLALWIGLSVLGVLEVSTRALIVSAGIIAAYDVFLLIV